MYIDKLNDLYLKDKKGKIKCMKYDSADKEGETMSGEGLLSFWKAGEWKLEKWKEIIILQKYKKVKKIYQRLFTVKEAA